MLARLIDSRAVEEEVMAQKHFLRIYEHSCKGRFMFFVQGIKKISLTLCSQIGFSGISLLYKTWPADALLSHVG